MDQAIAKLDLKEGDVLLVDIEVINLDTMPMPEGVLIIPVLGLRGRPVADSVAILRTAPTT